MPAAQMHWTLTKPGAAAVDAHTVRRVSEKAETRTVM